MNNLTSSQDVNFKKWRKFLKRVWPFRFIPFIDFVLASGSLATGKMHNDSDFDVIVGVKPGRIFTVRAFCVLIFGLLGRRAVHYSPNQKSTPLQYFKVLKRGRHPFRDKFCFNHFVTPTAYQLSPPHDDYCRNLYPKLVPIFGKPEMIQAFLDANADWLNKKVQYKRDKRHMYLGNGFTARFLEIFLSGSFGDWLERKLKSVQVKRIEQNLKLLSGYKPKIIYSDAELEFHPDTHRIEMLR